jgi:precorrin-6B methylase 2
MPVRDSEQISDWWSDFFKAPWETFQAALKPGDTEADARFVQAALGLHVNSKLLDAPSGDGRLSVALARQGVTVSAVELQPALVARCEQDAARHGVKVDVRIGDLRADLPPGPFDAVLCYWGSFGYFGDDENAGLLRAFGAVTRPGGALLLETHCTETVLPAFASRSSRDVGGILVEEVRRFDPVTSRLFAHWSYKQASRPPVERHSAIRLYSLRELDEMLRDAGFRDVRVLGPDEGYQDARACIRAERRP